MVGALQCQDLVSWRIRILRARHQWNPCDTQATGAMRITLTVMRLAIVSSSFWPASHNSRSCSLCYFRTNTEQLRVLQFLTSLWKACHSAEYPWFLLHRTSQLLLNSLALVGNVTRLLQHRHTVFCALHISVLWPMEKLVYID
jgi:hypothetical protein